jgi:hypothetical protein
MRVPAAPRVGLDAPRSPGFDAPRIPPPQNPAPEQIQQLGQGLSSLGGQMTRIGLHIQDQVNQSEVQLVDAAMAEEITRRWTEYRQTIGQGALYGRETVVKGLEETQRKLAAGLKNNEQREAFAMASRQRLADAQARIDAHYAGEARTFEFAVASARAEAALGARNAALDDNPDEAAAHDQAMRIEVQRMAQLQGLVKEPAEALLRQATTKMHALRIDELLAGERGLEAGAYLRQAIERGEIDPEQVPKMRRMVSRVELDDKAGRMALDLVRDLTAVPVQQPTADVQVEGDLFQVTTWQGELERAGRAEPVRKPVPILRPTFLQEARDQLNEQFQAGKISAAERDAVFAKVREEHDVARTTDAAQGKAAIEAGEQWLMQNPMRSVQGLATENPALFDELQQRGAIPDLNAFADSGRRYTTDPAAWMRSRSVTDEQLRQVKADELFVAFRGRLGNADLDQLMARHAKAQGTATAEQTSILSTGDRVERAARAIGVLPKDAGAKPSDSQQSRYEDWRTEVNAAVEGESARLKRKLTDQELQGVLDGMVADKVKTAGWFGADREAVLSTVPGKDTGEGYVYVGDEQLFLRDVPRTQWAEISAFLRTKGQSPTAQTIMELWAARGRPGAPR